MFGGSNNNGKGPWDPLRDLDDFKKLFSGDGRVFFPSSMVSSNGLGHPGLYMSSSSTNWMPSVDLLDTPQNYVLTAEMPGVMKDNIHVDVSENRVCLSGKRLFDNCKIDPNTQDIYLFREIMPGEFKRCFTLPQKINESKVDAHLNEGFLEISLAKESPGKTLKSRMSPIKLK